MYLEYSPNCHFLSDSFSYSTRYLKLILLMTSIPIPITRQKGLRLERQDLLSLQFKFKTKSSIQN